MFTLVFLIILSANLVGVESFVFGLFRYRQPLHRSRASVEIVESTDDYDSFYADFDPSGSDSEVQGFNENSRHDYTRDADADNSNVDVDTVNQLIARRFAMKKSGNFEEADRIRDELLDQHGVLVRDKDKRWRTGCSRSGSGLKWLGAFPRTDGSNQPKAKDLGPNGHDYVLAGDNSENVSNLSEEEIHRLLAERITCKLNRDYEGADKIQAELIQEGVFIDEKKRQFRTDGRSFRQFAPREYTISPLSNPPDDELMAEIESLIKTRALLRSEAMFQRSDAIRDDLLDRFGVQLNDKSLEWSVGNPSFVTHGFHDRDVPYQMAEYSSTPENIDEIERLIQERDGARASRDFGKADEIRNTLLEQFDVQLNDKRRQWRVGNQGPSRPPERIETRAHTYKQRGGGTLSQEDMHLVSELLAQRDELKRNRQYDEADTIRDKLLKDYDISVDDRNAEWHLRDAPYVMATNTREVDEETQKEVQEMIAQRTRARKMKEFETADDIRSDLEKNFRVTLNDRLREWHIE